MVLSRRTFSALAGTAALGFSLGGSGSDDHKRHIMAFISRSGYPHHELGVDGQVFKLNSPLVFVSMPLTNTSFFFFVAVSVTDLSNIAEAWAIGWPVESVTFP